MGLYSTQNSGFDLGKTIKHELHDFPGCEIAKAKLIVKSTNESLQVQFNPQSLNFTGKINKSQKPEVNTQGIEVVDIYAKPVITMSVELLFDATNDSGMTDGASGAKFLKNIAVNTAKQTASKMVSGSKIFPIFYGDVSKNLDFFYELMTNYNKRKVEFAWNQLSFVGDVENIAINVILFDTSGNPTRAKISLSIVQTLQNQFVGRKASKNPIKAAADMITRKEKA